MNRRLTTKQILRADRSAVVMARRTWVRERFLSLPTLERLEERRLLASWVVSSPLDNSNQGTLRWAVEAANQNPGADTILFDASVFGSLRTITLTNGQLSLSDTSGATTITGPGTNRLTISGGGSNRVFLVGSGVTASMSGMKISRGLAAQGGGIFVLEQGDLSLNNVIITNNSATGSAGGLFNGGTASLTACTLSDNEAGSDGGGMSNVGRAELTSCTISGNEAGTFGGGFYNGRTATLTDCTISGNSAGSGGGLGLVDGRTTVTGCTVKDNTAIEAGGGVFSAGEATIASSILSGNDASNGGGLSVNDGRVTLTSSTISGNTASESGGGVYVDRLATNDGTLYYGEARLSACTVSGNTAGDSGGGIFAMSTSSGAGLRTPAVSLANVTLAGNDASGPGGGVALHELNPTSAFDIASLANCTVSGNDADVGGGLYIDGSVSINNTIVAEQASGGDIENPLGWILDGNRNLIGDGSGGVSGSGNLVGTTNNPLDPLLSPLGDHGGPTLTMALLPGSPALDAGATLSDVAVDQRGVSRPQGRAYDIGSFESKGFVLTPVESSTPQDSLPGEVFDYPLAVVVQAVDPLDSVNGGVIRFAAPQSGASATLSQTTVTVVNGKASVVATANSILGEYVVTASASGSSSVNFNLANVTIRISPSWLPHANAGTSYRQTLKATGGAGGPFSFSIVAGSLPQGFSLTSAGVLSGRSNTASSTPLSIKVTGAGGVSAVQNYTFTVDAGAASRLVIVTQPSTTATAGVPFATQPVVALQDRFGNTIDGEDITVTATATGSVDLQGVTTVSLADGLATFGGLSYNKAGRLTIRFTTSAGRFNATANAITVSPGETSRLVISGFPTELTAGTNRAFTVSAQDAFGNVTPSYTGIVSIASSDPNAALPTPATLRNGTGSFRARLVTAGTQWVGATDGAISSSQDVLITPAAAAKLRVSAPSSVVAGVAFSLTVTAFDAFDNLATGYRGSVQFSSTDRLASLPALYTFRQADEGVHSFTATLKTTGSQTITATDRIRRTINGTASMTVNSSSTATGGLDGGESLTLGIIDGPLAFEFPSSSPRSLKKASEKTLLVDAL